MQNITRFVEAKLKLVVNRQKSKAAHLSDCAFLGFQIRRGRIVWTDKALKRFRERIQEITLGTSPDQPDDSAEDDQTGDDDDRHARCRIRRAAGIRSRVIGKPRTWRRGERQVARARPRPWRRRQRCLRAPEGRGRRASL